MAQKEAKNKTFDVPPQNKRRIKMEEQVLTIAEMQALQELWIDTTKASMFWVKKK